MNRARSYAAAFVALIAFMGMALTLTGPASAGQRSNGDLAATQPLLFHKPVPTRVATAQTQYIVHKGDTLSKIAKKFYGHANRWPALWWTNHKKVHNPNNLLVGEKLTLNTWHPNDPQLMVKAMRHIPKPKVIHYVAHHSSIVGDSHSSAAPTVTVGYSGGSSFRSCVLRAESGGNYSAYNPSSGAGGAYQFLQSTWTALGFPGSPQSASPAMQDAAFNKAYAQSGTSPWAPYDGC